MKVNKCLMASVMLLLAFAVMGCPSQRPVNVVITPGLADEFYEAAKDGDMSKAQAMVAQNPNFVNARESYLSLAPLAGACYGGQFEMVKFLLNNGAEVDARSEGGSTPLVEAVARNSVEIAGYLVDHGADVNSKDNDGKTPLHWAAERGHVDAVKFLIAKGADVNAAMNDGTTPLMAALDQKENAAADLLRAAGASGGAAPAGNDDDDYGWLDDLMAGSTEPLSKADEFYEAAKAGDMAKVKAMLADDPALVNAPESFLSLVPLHGACYGGQLEMVKFLIAKGADVSARSEGGSTPLVEAVAQNKVEISKYLVAHGAKVNTLDNKGKTPLHWAAERGHVEVLKFLIAKGAKVNAKMNDGTTPLKAALDENQQATAELLRKNGGVE
ncbi:MAG TPA: ankyrin repeat domain-containing protein [bacterium]|nr:ankyrin repeat domain-containing protein [bacterium]